MKIDPDDVAVVTEIEYRTPDHEVLLSFNGDDQAVLFSQWWNQKGLQAFTKWAKDKDVW